MFVGLGVGNMAITSLRALLFTAGGVVAVGGVAYVSGAFDRPAAPPSQAEGAAAAPAAAASGTQGRVTASADAKAGTPATAGDTATAPKAPAAPAPAATVIAPTFDVVRVQGDGSVVVAGKAAANARVEIVHGSVVLGETKAGPDGTFAIVLDDPLKPGDYQIVLRSTAPNSVVATSEQTAVVSVPEKAGGQVLAMVEEPGKPAELLTVPEPEKRAELPAPATQPAAGQAGGTPSADAPAAPAPAPQPATTTPASTSAETPAKPVAGPKVVVEAVEIDGSKIFVAGRADAGRKVRAYANDILLGDAVTSPDGHFLVEAKRDIPVGQYTVRVDALDADGVKVAARATVPFEREPGEAISAVAPDATKPAQADTKVAAAEQPTTAPASSAGSSAASEAAVPETVAPKLQHTDGAVIIRRGDSLWRISRRVYGYGTRYSTIYLANQEQISDPDRIWPGQVFTVPDRSKEGEPADLKALGDQATTAPAQ